MVEHVPAQTSQPFLDEEASTGQPAERTGKRLATYDDLGTVIRDRKGRMEKRLSPG